MNSPDKSSLLPHHDKRFDGHRNASERFVRGKLGLAHAHALGRLAVVDHTDVINVANQVGIEPWSAGRYHPGTKEAAITATPDVDNPEMATHRLIGAGVHELTHSATIETVAENNEHPYWLEAMAGLGEHLYLNSIDDQPWRQKVKPIKAHRKGVDLVLPPNFRYFGGADDEKMNSTQGLVAATGLAISQRASNIGSRRLLAASHPKERTHFPLIKESFEKLKPGLVAEIESYPHTTEGVLQATAVVQAIGRAKGHFPRY